MQVCFHLRRPLELTTICVKLYAIGWPRQPATGDMVKNNITLLNHDDDTGITVRYLFTSFENANNVNYNSLGINWLICLNAHEKKGLLLCSFANAKQNHVFNYSDEILHWFSGLFASTVFKMKAIDIFWGHWADPGSPNVKSKRSFASEC